MSYCLLPYSCVKTCDHLAEEEGAALLRFCLHCGLCTVCLVLFAFPFGVIVRLCSVIVVLPAHLLYQFASRGI